MALDALIDRLQSEKWPVSPHKAGDLDITEDVSAYRVNTEERSLPAFRLDGDEWGLRLELFRLAQKSGQAFDACPMNES